MGKLSILFPRQRVPEWLCKITPANRAHIGSVVIVDRRPDRPLARLLFPWGCIIYVTGGEEPVNMDVRFDYALSPIIRLPQAPNVRAWVIRRLGGIPAAEHAALQERYEALELELDAIPERE